MAGSEASKIELDFITPHWPAAAHVHACTSTRQGGVSTGAYQGLNLALHVSDDAADVARNRQILVQALDLPTEPVWLDQVHSARVIRAGGDTTNLTADAACTDQPGVVCAVLTADCLPVFFTDRAGSCVGIAHAGWRGLHAGVISATLEMMHRLSAAGEIMAWLGPAIGPVGFEVGAEVVDAFCARHPANASAFTRTDPEHWLCDLYQLARIELAHAGVDEVYGGGLCTWSDPGRFYSWRRDGETGRIASLIWMSPPA